MSKFDLILRWAIVVLIAEFGMVNFKVVAKKAPNIVAAFLVNQVVPDVVRIPPINTLKVTYPSGVEVKVGNELIPAEVQEAPSVSWRASPEEFFTLALTDPDAPSRADPQLREYKHWLVGNIRGYDVSSGETLAEYMGSAPPENTGLHRYVFLLYKQPGKIDFEESSNGSDEGRPGFKIADFASKYKLGNPIAGNFFQAQYHE